MTTVTVFFEIFKKLDQRSLSGSKGQQIKYCWKCVNELSKSRSNVNIKVTTDRWTDQTTLYKIFSRQKSPIII